MTKKEKNYQEIISKLVKKQSFLDKTLLHNLLSHDCEQIFNFTCEIEVDNFIYLYGRQSFDYCVKQSNFWLGGENYYDNIKINPYVVLTKLYQLTLPILIKYYMKE